MERQLIRVLIWRKGGRMKWEKNKSTTPSLDFPFSLNQNKASSFSEREDARFGGSGIK